MTKVIGPELRFEAVFGGAVWGRHDAGVVDQQVEVFVFLCETLRECVDRGQISQVEGINLVWEDGTESLMLLRAASPREAERQAMMVIAPCRASSIAVSKPTPLLPPVMIAVLPVKSGISLRSSVLSSAMVSCPFLVGMFLFS